MYKAVSSQVVKNIPEFAFWCFLWQQLDKITFIFMWTLKWDKKIGGFSYVNASKECSKMQNIVKVNVDLGLKITCFYKL